MTLLKFPSGNEKLKSLSRFMGYKILDVVTFDLPAGWTCAKANICKTFFDPKKHNERTGSKGKLVKVGRVTCYAAKVEAYAPAAMRLHWHNFDLLKKLKFSDMVELISKSLPARAKIVRIHSSGDFFRLDYFLAWCEVARNNPDVVFFGYTKHLDYAVNQDMPENMYLHYSYGSLDDGRRDKMSVNVPTCYIEEFDGQFPDVPVVCGTHETSHEDYLKIIARESFKIVIH